MDKKIKKWLCCVILAFAVIWCGKSILCSQINVAAEENENKEIQGTFGDNIKWNLKDGIFRVSGTGEVPQAFARQLYNQDDNEFDLDDVKEIVIEKGITQIGKSAFEGCDMTEKIVLPEGIETIGEEAFDGLSSLTQINLPDGLKSIGEEAFYACGFKKLQIPESVENIEDGAFYQCAALEEINIPKGLTKINDETFRGCKSLKKIDFPSNLESIGEYALGWCTGLEEINIPEKVSSIGKGAFAGCSGIKEIRWPDQIKVINDGMFAGCKLLTNIYMPDDLKSIGKSAFSNCTNIEEMKIPQTVKTIGAKAFEGCEKLQDIEIPDRLTVLEKNIFEGCTSLKEFQFSKAIQNIKEGAFEDCTALKYLVIPNSVTQIGKEAFSGCKGLEYIKISGNVEALRDYTFKNCESLTSIEIPSGVLTLEYKVITGCKNLKMVTIPENVVSMQGYSIGLDMKDVMIIGAEGSEAERYAKENEITFKSYNDWNCEHDYERIVLKTATFTRDGAEARRCMKCGYTILQNLSHPVSIKAKQESLPYSGGRVFPQVEIKLADGNILENTYYSCEDEEDHINPGSYSMKVVLKNGYEGTMQCAYKIVKSDRRLSYNGKKEITGSYDNAILLNMKADGHNAKIVYKVSDPAKLSVDAKGAIRAKSIGNYTVTAYVPEDQHYKKSNVIKVKVRIVPAKVKVKSIKATTGRKITIKWSKDTKVDGFYINYSTKKNMLGAKSIKISNNKTISATLKNLKSKKKYYIEIYGYKKMKSGKSYKEIIGNITKKTIKTK